jgi:hypothetical protein
MERSLEEPPGVGEVRSVDQRIREQDREPDRFDWILAVSRDLE